MSTLRLGLRTFLFFFWGGGVQWFSERTWGFRFWGFRVPAARSKQLELGYGVGYF